jgi:hypothetical protein
MPVFKTGAINHSATSPGEKNLSKAMSPKGALESPNGALKKMTCRQHTIVANHYLSVLRQ